MPFRFSDNIDRKPYVGSTEIAEAYVGITKIYPSWGWFIEKYPYDGFQYKLHSNNYIVVTETYDNSSETATGLIILNYEDGKVVKEYHNETMHLEENNFAANIDVWLDANGSICWLDDDANIVKTSPIYYTKRYVFKDSAGYVYATKQSDVVAGTNPRGQITRTLFNADGTVAEETIVKNSSVWYLPSNNQASFAAVDNGSDVNYSRAVADTNYTYAVVSSSNPTNQVMVQKISLDGNTVTKIGDYYVLDVFKDPLSGDIIAGRNANPTAYKMNDSITSASTASGLTSFFTQSSSYGKRITVSKVYDYVNDKTYLSLTSNGGGTVLSSTYNGLYTYGTSYSLVHKELKVVRYMQIGEIILKIVARTDYDTNPTPVTYDVYSLSPVEGQEIWNWTSTHQFTFTADKILGSVSAYDSYDVFCFTGKDYFIINNYKIKYIPENTGNENNEETPEEGVNDGE